MFDVKLLRDDLESVEAMLRARHAKIDLSAFAALDQRRRDLIKETDSLKSERKTQSKKIGQMMKAGEDVEPVKAEVAKIGDRIKELDAELARCNSDLDELLSGIPNMLDASTPAGNSEDDNLQVALHGEPTAFDFEPKDHVDLGTHLGLFDFERAAKIAGARFCVLRGDAARLERALINFMCDVHHEQGYFEVMPPFIVNGDSMFGTGQFPKMKEDSFHLAGSDYHLIPTAEVPVTNLHRDEILNEKQLPLNYQAFTPCFRSEAGSYGRDTRGLIRQHQFNKVEMVKFVLPENSEAEHEKLRDDAEEILRRLELPYRVMLLCSADVSFAAAKCYDLEVWLPGQQAYREISSCSNFGDFQARRAKIRYKGASGKGLIHTINGSGLAIGRTLVAILENYQNADGSIRIPTALQPYMGNKTLIEKQPI